MSKQSPYAYPCTIKRDEIGTVPDLTTKVHRERRPRNYELLWPKETVKKLLEINNANPRKQSFQQVF